jgi:signal transduction histidine kinase
LSDGRRAVIRSLRFRLTIGAIVAIGLSLALVWFVLSRLFTDYVVKQYLTEMTVLSDNLTASVTLKDGKLSLISTASDSRLNLPAGGRYWALEENEITLERSRSLWDTTISEENMVPSVYPPFLEGTGPDGEPILVLAQDSTLGEGRNAHTFCIYTGFPRLELEAALKGFHEELLRMLLVTAALLGVAAIAQAIVGLSPLSRLRAKVSDVRSGKLSALGDEGPNEVQPLVREIDQLLEERASAVERARQRASDLAHGLKTPLTVLAQLAEKMEPREAEIALRQVDIIRQRADRQLQAARLGVERMATADIGDLTARLVQVLKPATAHKGLEWKVRSSGDLRVEADPADIAEAIGNVLDNATKWARTRIEVDATRNGDQVAIRISDDGPGISAIDRVSVLQRGVHSNGADGGSGLGLAITADIAEAYGATFELGTADIGGLEAEMQFPVRARRPENIA